MLSFLQKRPQSADWDGLERSDTFGSIQVRDAAAKILEHTTLADIMNGKGAEPGKRRKKKQDSPSVLSMVAHGNPSRGQG